MSRIARRMRVSRISSQVAPTLPPPSELWVLDTALRGRAARAVRGRLRRMEPVVLVAPPWAGVPRFLEDVSLDLAVGEPTVGCRTVSFRSAAGRSQAEAWQIALHLFGQLGQRGWRRSAPATVADRRGFRWALEQVLEEAHRSAPHPVALLAHDVERLPLELLEDIASAWAGYRDRHPVDRRCTVLLATTDAADWLQLGPAPQVALVDFAAPEVESALTSVAGGLPARELESVARFTGGIPGLVERIGDVARRSGRLPRGPREMLASCGPVERELRAAVDQAIAHDQLADRLVSLRPGEPEPVEPTVDTPLLRAGLVRRVRRAGGELIELRAPVIRDLIS